jgi:hypothetical protein
MKPSHSWPSNLRYVTLDVRLPGCEVNLVKQVAECISSLEVLRLNLGHLTSQYWSVLRDATGSIMDCKMWDNCEDVFDQYGFQDDSFEY